MFFSEDSVSLELLGVFKIKRRKYVNIRSHSRSYDTISLRISGQGDFKTEKGDFSVGRGDLLYMPRNADYQQKSENETIIAVHFINYSFKSSNDIVASSVEDIEYVEKLMLEMYDVWKNLNVGYRHKCTSLLYELLYFMRCREHTRIIGSTTAEGKIRPALDHIHSHYRSNTPDIESLAEMCALSEPYFRKIFKKTYGVSPIRYIIDLKLDFASHLLRSDLYTVGEAAYRSGFTDTKYFSRLFKQKYGVSPREYQDITSFEAPSQ